MSAGKVSADREIEALREAIARIDAHVVDLVARRLALARQIGGIKRSRQLPIQDFHVEKLVIARNRRLARQSGLSPSVADDLSRLLIEHAVHAQNVDRRSPARRKTTRGEQVLIIGGLGGMGRWLARFFDSLGHQVSIFDRPSVGTRSEFPRERDLARAVKAHTVIVLATPIDATAAVLERIAAVGTEALIFDVCSLKGPIAYTARRAISEGLRFASIHPMFGPDVEVLAGRNILLCETKGVDHSRAVASFFEHTSASLISITFTTTA
jgi:chorismate mutase/prephenate dehydrogenase